MHNHNSENGWTLYYSEEGYPYYYNEFTNESVWADYADDYEIADENRNDVVDNFDHELNEIDDEVGENDDDDNDELEDEEEKLDDEDESESDESTDNEAGSNFYSNNMNASKHDKYDIDVSSINKNICFEKLMYCLYRLIQWVKNNSNLNFNPL
jgi:hypothetical protein